MQHFLCTFIKGRFSSSFYRFHSNTVLVFEFFVLVDVFFMTLLASLPNRSIREDIKILFDNQLSFSLHLYILYLGTLSSYIGNGPVITRNLILVPMNSRRTLWIRLRAFGLVFLKHQVQQPSSSYSYQPLLHHYW